MDSRCTSAWPKQSLRPPPYPLDTLLTSERCSPGNCACRRQQNHIRQDDREALHMGGEDQMLKTQPTNPVCIHTYVNFVEECCAGCDVCFVCCQCHVCMLMQLLGSMKPLVQDVDRLTFHDLVILLRNANSETAIPPPLQSIPSRTPEKFPRSSHMVEFSMVHTPQGNTGGRNSERANFESWP